nr:lipid-A-disaccharide synthase N-terminal domain-containing protein [Pseudaminobacter soli]
MWLGIGLLGQALFFMRFLVQWIASERRRRSVVPRAFWYFSLAGGVVLLTYAVYRRDPVFIIGQATGIFIYLRNLHLSRPAASEPGDAAEC